jgi:hypothetical protein
LSTLRYTTGKYILLLLDLDLPASSCAEMNYSPLDP